MFVEQNLSIYRENDDKRRRKEELVKNSWLCNKESNDKQVIEITDQFNIFKRMLRSVLVLF